MVTGTRWVGRAFQSLIVIGRKLYFVLFVVGSDFNESFGVWSCTTVCWLVDIIRISTGEFWFTALWKAMSLLFFLLIWRGCQFKSMSLAVTLSWHEHFPFTKRAPFRWTFSRAWMSCLWYESHTVEVYSRCGSTNEVNALFLTPGLQPLRCLRSRLRIFWAFSVISPMWCFHVKSDVNSTPRYGWCCTRRRMWLSIVYSVSKTVSWDLVVVVYGLVWCQWYSRQSSARSLILVCGDILFAMSFT